MHIGSNCCIYQGVTIGTSKRYDDKYPIIGNNVTIYAGAVVVGKIKVGDNAVIGANSVVLNDVLENTTVVGIPAKNIYANN